MSSEVQKIAFVMPLFPATTETWIIDQVAHLRDRGIEVRVFSFRRGDTSKLASRYHEYRMGDDAVYLDMPENFFRRTIAVVPRAWKLLMHEPMALLRALNFVKYGRQALSLQLIFWAEPFIGRDFDLYHCHFGHAANMFLDIRYVLGIKAKIVTTFYGLEISSKIKRKGIGFYDELKKHCSAYFVMSNNMKERVLALGFDEKKVHVLPISLDIESYPFKERSLGPDEAIQLAQVGRFVEKKGFDDLLRALAVVKEKTDKKFVCDIVGYGKLEKQLRALAKELDVEDVVSFKGRLDQQEIIDLYQRTHLYLQPSKTAANGDME